MTEPLLVFLHALGASAAEWRQVVDRLEGHDCLALDLPGFGAVADAGHADVATMTDWLADQIRARAPAGCVLIGHSMGGKIATLVAARAAAGEAGLSGVIGVVLVAASPPAPEPMDEDRRAQMIDWFADGQPAEADAATFIDTNTAARLPDELRAPAIADVRRANRQAWLGWLERGSREDWRAQAGLIDIPALIVAGAEDGDLGEEAQRRLNLPHYATADMRVVPGAAHLIPYEQPDALAALIAGHVEAVSQAMLPPRFAAILASDRVGRQTRAAMLARMRPVDAPTWSDAERSTAAALVGCILPGCGDRHELADRILAGIAGGPGDGWRFAALPPDAEAWRRGLATLDAVTGGLAVLDGGAQADWLDRIARRDIPPPAGVDHLSPEEMALWFEDVRAETARCWVSLPATMAAIGYDGFAVGGDGLRKQGYTRTGTDDPEAWQIAAEQAS